MSFWQVVQKKRKAKDYTGILTVGSLPANDGTYDVLPNIFHYYLETIFFCPKIDWETFKQSYCDYMKHGARNYVQNGYADFLFAYTDSGDFSISFDPQENDPQALSDEIRRVISE